MGREEQIEEREVLDSIFPDEIQDMSATEFRVSITLDTNKQPEDDTPEPIILLNVTYPEAYPDEAPRLDVTQPPNAPKFTYLDIQDDKAQLLDTLAPTIEENLSMAMVYSLVIALKEAAEQLIAERQQAIQAQKELEASRAEEEENRKFEGEKVTRESFLEWIARFKVDMDEEAARRHAEIEAEEKKRRGGKTEEKRLTGKQLWEQGLVGKVLEDDEDGEDAVASMQALKVEG